MGIRAVHRDATHHHPPDPALSVQESPLIVRQSALVIPSPVQA
jgi:hypothetical protein